MFSDLMNLSGQLSAIARAGIIAAICFVQLVALTQGAQAASFTSYLGYGMAGNAEVVKLQQFLAEKGFFKEAPTGNFYGITERALMAYQKSVGIDATGYFGPLTMARVNAELATGEVAGATTVRGTEKVTWNTGDYPKGALISLHLIKKISNDPARFELVRMLTPQTVNDGVEYWSPMAEDGVGEFYIEVACAESYQLQGSCSARIEPLSDR